jgi:tetratricopeptide (TPR) repeat protein
MTKFILGWIVLTIGCAGFAAEQPTGDVKAWKRYQAAGEKALKAKDTNEAGKQFALAANEAEQIPNGESRLRDSLKELAPLLVSHRKYDQAQAAYERLCALYAQELGSNDVRVGHCLTALGQAYAYGNRLDAAEQALLRAQKILEIKLGALDPDMAFVHSSLAAVYRQTRRYDQAEALYKTAIRIAESPRTQTQFASGGLTQSYYRPRYEIVAGLMNDLALVYRDQDRVSDTEEMFKRALKTYEEARGGQSSGTAMVLHNLGMLYLSQRNFAQAEAALSRALAIREKAFGPGHPAVADTLELLAVAVEPQNRDKANALRVRARQIRIHAG